MEQKINYFLVTLLIVITLSVSIGQMMAVQKQEQAGTGCTKNPVIFMLGDSNSDTGGFDTVQGVIQTYPRGRLFPRNPSGRYSDGKLIIDFLVENLTATYLTPYLNAFEPNFVNGVNFAIFGSYISNNTYDLNFQLRQLTRLKNVSGELQSQGYKDLNGTFKNALYVIDIGQNDLTFGDHSKIPELVSRIEQAIMSIYGFGGRNFWVHNSGPYGCLPEILYWNKVNSSDYDEIGCIKPFNDAVKLFNSQLEVRCRQLREKFKDATIVFVDVYTIKYDLIAYYGLYGFVNPLMACCEPCGFYGENICPDGSKYISWDGIHYTEAANRIIASKILSKSFSKPPLPFNFFCNI